MTISAKPAAAVYIRDSVVADIGVKYVERKIVGVEYLDRPESGCRAILDKRSGEWNLHMVCGLPRCEDFNGSMTSYCQYHFMTYTQPHHRR